MRLADAIKSTKEAGNTKDILEFLGIDMLNDYNKKYYSEKIERLPKGEYFISDLDGTFFRGTLQKEAVSLFIKYVVSKELYNINTDNYYEFLKDLEYFNKLEKQAFNKEINFGEYLNAGIFLLLKHKDLVNWEDFLTFIKYHFSSKEKIKPFRFSMKKMKEVLDSGKIFLFISGAPDFIFDIYLELLKDYIVKNIGKSESNNVYGFGTNIGGTCNYFCPMWGSQNKTDFINILKNKKIITKTIGGMGDTSGDFGISASLDKGNDFFFVNPEKKVLERFDELKTDGINYKMIIERKDLICEINKENIKFLM
ncbi:hypothetical protein BLD25_02960 [Candidatus Gracilibacteria bacterium GN02-872]|nr:hypothetical protein BLD25_02960 [Candidatus Gracilibacteria bacterium GN02-872]